MRCLRKREVLGHLLPLNVNFTHENDKLSNKHEGWQPPSTPHHPLGFATGAPGNWSVLRWDLWYTDYTLLKHIPYFFLKSYFFCDIFLCCFLFFCFPLLIVFLFLLLLLFLTLFCLLILNYIFALIPMIFQKGLNSRFDVPKFLCSFTDMSYWVIA